MNYRITLIFILIFCYNSSASSEIQISINENNHQKKTLMNVFLRQVGVKYFCRTNNVPEHQIHVKNLNSLSAPFNGKDNISPDCKNTLHWGNSTMCYRRGEKSVVDDVLRWCSNV